MAIFCRKQLSTPIRCNERIKAARTAAGFSLDTLAEKTGIAKKYLENIENANFKNLPTAKAFRLAYLKTLSKKLNLDYKNLVYHFIKEGGLENCDKNNLSRERRCSLKPFSLLARNLIIGVCVILFCSYLVWQIHGIMVPPKLIIYSPLEGFVFSQPTALAEGETGKECRLLVNGQEINVNNKGKFSTTVNLTHGINTITFSASKKHGKTTTLIRHVVMNSKVENVNLK